MEDLGVLLLMVPLSIAAGVALVCVAANWAWRRVKAAGAAPGFRDAIEKYSAEPVGERRNAEEIQKDR